MGGRHLASPLFTGEQTEAVGPDPTAPRRRQPGGAQGRFRLTTWGAGKAVVPAMQREGQVSPWSSQPGTLSPTLRALGLGEELRFGCKESL